MNALRHVSAIAVLLMAGASYDDRKPELILMADQRPLTSAEYNTAIKAWEQGKKSFTERESYLKDSKLDSALFIPGQNWGDVTMNPFREFLATKPSQDRVNQLRLHTQAFTGYSLYHLAWGVNLPAPPEMVPVAELDLKHRGKQIDTSTYRTFTEIREEVPEKYLPRVPRVMGEIGWDIDGYTVNLDTVPFMESMALMYRTGILGWLEKRIAAGRSVTILEIGSGYGGFPYLFAKSFPQVSYWCCDLAEVQGVAGIYLSVALPDQWKGLLPDCPSTSGPGVYLVANHRFEEFAKPGRKVDLVINMMSLSEMPAAQVNYYGQKASELVGNDGVFFEQNFDETSRGWADPKKVMPNYFKANEFVGQAPNKGRTHIWANNSAVLEAIRAERPRAVPEPDRRYWLVAPTSVFLIVLLIIRFVRRKPKATTAAT